jgi:hypothetical protein
LLGRVDIGVAVDGGVGRGAKRVGMGMEGVDCDVVGLSLAQLLVLEGQEWIVLGSEVGGVSGG